MVSQRSHGGFNRREPFGRHNVIDKPNLKGCICIDRTTIEHHPQCLCSTINTVRVIEFARQTLRSAIARKQVQIDFWLAEFGVLGRNDVRAGEYQFVTASQCWPVNRRNDGNIQILKRSEGRLSGVR